MAAILMTCPITSTIVRTGQHAGPAAFEREDFGDARFRCTSCNQIHAWTKDQAWLASSADERMTTLGLRAVSAQRSST